MKSLLLYALGIAVCGMSSYGQGTPYIEFLPPLSRVATLPSIFDGFREGLVSSNTATYTRTVSGLTVTSELVSDGPPTATDACNLFPNQTFRDVVQFVIHSQSFQEKLDITYVWSGLLFDPFSLSDPLSGTRTDRNIVYPTNTPVTVYIPRQLVRKVQYPWQCLPNTYLRDYQSNVLRTSVSISVAFSSDTTRTLTKVSGDNQTTGIGNVLASPLVVKVTNQSGSPVAGVTVNFSLSGPGGSPNPSLTPSAVLTGADGTASTSFTAGSVPGAYQVSATCAGCTPGSVSFTETVAARVLTISNGDKQTVATNAKAALPLVVKVTNQSGTPLAGITVSFNVAGPSGSTNAAVTPSSFVTGADGAASTSFTAGTAAGTYQVSATCTGCAPKSVVFTLIVECRTFETVSVRPLNGDSPLVAKMTATFKPPSGLSLREAADACQFVSFNWQQLITELPSPSPFALRGIPGALTAPPAFLDPPIGGYEHQTYVDLSNPFFYDIFDSSPRGLRAKEPDQYTLTFADQPANFCLQGDLGYDPYASGLPALIKCGMNGAPQGSVMRFTTRLVGMRKSNNTVTYIPSDPLYEWEWTSNFNGTSGHTVQLNSDSPIDPGSGTGHVLITRLNGMAQTPPQISCVATPASLWPPNGQSVIVTVSGTSSPGTQSINRAWYTVVDEYGQVQPSANISVKSDGSYSIGVALISARKGDDLDGRKYVIRVRAEDKIGNIGGCLVSITVPHDQKQ